MDKDDFLNIVVPLGLIAVCILLFGGFIAHSMGYAEGRDYGIDKMEKQAIYYEYGSLNRDGHFIWKEDLLRENFLKDLEFFQRNEKKMKEQLVPNIPFPSNKIDPSQPF